MRRLLLLLFGSIVCFAVRAQQEVKKQTKDALSDAFTNYFDKKKDTGSLTLPKTLYLVNPKPGIHRLPQDNMPCLVPDPNAMVAIPNLWKGETKVPFKGGSPRIPNPARPLRLSPSRPLLIQPDTNTDTK